MKHVTRRDKVNQLIGAGRILWAMWDNSYYSMGEKASKRIEEEMMYLFGKNWAGNITKVIGDTCEIPTVAELSLDDNTLE